MTDANPPKDVAPLKRCPKGHEIGQQWPGGVKCSKRRCGELDHKLNPGGAGGELDLDALRKADPMAVARDQRRNLIDAPKNLTADQARPWAEAELAKMLPDAVANIKWDLMYGSDKARSEATDKVLRANGMDRREGNAAASGGTIILNIGAGQTGIPWLERVKPAAPVVGELEKGKK